MAKIVVFDTVLNSGCRDKAYTITADIRDVSLRTQYHRDGTCYHRSALVNGEAYPLREKVYQQLLTLKKEYNDVIYLEE